MKHWRACKKALIGQLLAQNSPHEGHRVTVWQSSDKEQFQGEFFFDANKECKIHIESPLTGFKKDTPFYCYLTESDVAFKREKYTLGGKYLNFPPPIELKIYERRKNDRFYYKYQDHKDITYYSDRANLGDNEERVPIYRFSSVLVDISVTGAGFVVTEDQKQRILNKDYIYLTNITDQELPKPFKTQIRYITPYGQNKERLYKIGVEYESQLDEVSYKSITSVVEKKQKKTRGISPDRYCGLDEEDLEKLLNTIELKERNLSMALRDHIETLDRLRYMTTQMKIELFRSMDVDILAQALRLSSKELIYELLHELTENTQAEFLDRLGIERPASVLAQAQEKLVKFVHEKEGKGEFILDPRAFTTFA